MRPGEASGIAGVGVKSINISKNTKCEGSLLERILTLNDESVGSEWD